MEHYWHRLPGHIWFCAAEIYRAQVARARNGAVFVEIGAWKGRSTAFMAVEIINSGKDITFFTVDHWLGGDEPQHHADPDVIGGRLLDAFLENIAPVQNRVRWIRGYSTEAAARFADGSVDFIYLDAGHTFSEVKSDIEAWWPKLRADGVMAGDDWRFKDRSGDHGVRRAVTEFFGAISREIFVESGSPPHRDWDQWIVTKSGNPLIRSQPFDEPQKNVKLAD